MDVFNLNPKALVDTVVLATVLGIEPETIIRWRCIGRNHIPYIKVGRCVRYRVADILKYIEDNRVAHGESDE